MLRTFWTVLMAISTPALAAQPLVIAHRGAPGALPDHTLEGYRHAVEQGAHYIEPDLVSTKDGALIARHENEIGATTDVADKFPERKTTKTVDGESITGWFTEDFTLAEIKTLRARQPMAARPKDHDGKYAIPTFDEILLLREELSKTTGRAIGVYPETKHPSYFDALGLSLEEPLLKALSAHDLGKSDDPVFIQSFEVGNLQELAKHTDLPLLQLVWTSGSPWDKRDTGPTFAQMITPEGLEQVARYAAGIGAHKHQVIPLVDGALGKPTTLVADAHAADLLVHLYTFRSEPDALPRGLSPVDEVRAYIDAGADGLFCDFTEVGVAALASPAAP